MKRILATIQHNRLVNNISWIFFGNVAHALLRFVLDAFVARMLSLNDNGMLTYGSSRIGFVMSLCGFGFASIVSREFVEDESKAGEVLCSCIVTQSAASVLGVLVMQIVIRITAPGEPALYPIVLLQSLSSVLGTLSLTVFWFRYKNKANVVAIYRLVAFGIAAVLRVVVLLFTDSLLLYVTSTIAETVFFSIFLLISFLKSYKGKISYSFVTVKKILRSSYPFIFSAILTTVYAQTDKIMLKSMLDNESVALYSASAHLASAISIIPSTLIEGFRPVVMETKVKDEALYLKRFRQLYAIIFWVSVAYCLFVTFFAKYIILFVYSEKYIGAVSSLSLIVWYTTFSYFGAINNMYMVAEHKSKWVQVTTLAGALCNIALNYSLIPILGIVGAALASLLTQFVANFVLLWGIKDLRPGFYNMLRGITLKYIR